MLGDDVLGSWRVIDHDARDRAEPRRPRDGRRRARPPRPRVGRGRPADHDRASSSRTSSPGSAAGRRWSRRAWPGSTTTLALHNARRIGDPRATWGVIEGNPVHDAVRAIAAATGRRLRARRPARRPAADHPGLRRRDRSRCTRPPAPRRGERRCEPSPRPFDIVITTNSGYPLDQNLYQAVKGMSAAAEIVRPGGTIICAAECRDGLPDHGSYGQAAARGPLAGRPPRAHRRLAGDDPGPVAGPDPGSGPDEGAGPAADATA